MTIHLRQSTASQEIPLGYFLDSTDGNTEETGLTIADTDIKIWKTGATTLANKNSGGGTHISNGIYYAVLDATDTDTIGPLVIFVHVAGALAVRLECCVLDEAVYDVMYGTTAPATATNITAGTITTVTNLTNAPTNGDLTATMKASVNTEVDTALADYDAPTSAELVSEINSVQADIAALNNLSQADIRTATGLASANLDTQLDALPTAAEIASAVWSAVTRTLTSISDSSGVTTLLSRIGGALNITSGKVESNVKQINDTTITGDGSGTPWGPA